MAHDFVILLHEWTITGRTIKETKRSTRSMGTEIIIISTCSEYLKYGYALGIFHLWIIPRKSTNHRRIGYVWKDGQDRRSKGLYIIICRKKRRKSSLWGWNSKLQSSLRLDSIFIIINLAVKFSSTQKERGWLEDGTKTWSEEDDMVANTEHYILDRFAFK